jgi:hypothetical protein
MLGQPEKGSLKQQNQSFQQGEIGFFNAR